MGEARAKGDAVGWAGMAIARTLVETEQVVLRDLRCGSPRGGPGASQGGEGTHVVLVRRGAFAAHLGRREYVADSCTAMISWEAMEYRISHPGEHGDECLVMELSAELAEEALAPLRRRVDFELRLSAAMQREAAGFAARMRRGKGCANHGGCGERSEVVREDEGIRDVASGDRLGAEERVLEMLRELIGERGERRAAPRQRTGAAMAGTAGTTAAGAMAAGVAAGSAAGAVAERGPSTTTARQRLARRAVLALHRDLAANPSVTGIAAELGCSPFHLMRAMRQELGMSLRGYRIAARLGAALHRLAEGEEDLTRLALELGFASHAHLTDTCVRLLGAPPSELRRDLDGRASTFLEARRRATS